MFKAEKYKMQSKMIQRPIYAQCRICFKRYDMVEYGASCPSCKDKDFKDKKKK